MKVSVAQYSSPPSLLYSTDNLLGPAVGRPLFFSSVSSVFFEPLSVRDKMPDKSGRVILTKASSTP